MDLESIKQGAVNVVVLDGGIMLILKKKVNVMFAKEPDKFI